MKKQRFPKNGNWPLYARCLPILARVSQLARTLPPPPPSRRRALLTFHISELELRRKRKRERRG